MAARSWLLCAIWVDVVALAVCVTEVDVGPVYYRIS